MRQDTWDVSCRLLDVEVCKRLGDWAAMLISD